MLVEARQLVMMLLEVLDTFSVYKKVDLNIRINGGAAARLGGGRGRRGRAGRGGGLSGSKAGNSQNEGGGVLHDCWDTGSRRFVGWFNAAGMS